MDNTEKSGPVTGSSNEQEPSWPEAKKMLHSSMKQTSDYAGALIRLGVLSVLITFLIDRIGQFSFMTDGYFLSLGALIIILSAVWVTLAVKIFVYTFSNLAALLVPKSLFENPVFSVDPSIGFLGRLRLHTKNSIRLFVFLWLGGLVISLAIHASIASYYELGSFIDRR